MNKEFWREISFENDNYPNYRCPKCAKGILKLNGKPTLEKISKEIEDIIFVDENNTTNFGSIIGESKYKFSALLSCSNKKCKEAVFLLGDYFKNSRKWDEESFKEVKINFYTPKFFYPNLQIFELQSEVPQKIKDEINLSFSHFFYDLSSCANRMRTAIEILLDEIKAPKTKEVIQRPKCPMNDNKCPKNSPIEKTEKLRTLHIRLEYYKNKVDESVGILLIADKIIGNKGSHSGDISRDEILEAYGFFEEVLNMLFVKPRERELNNAKEIIKKKAKG